MVGDEVGTCSSTTAAMETGQDEDYTDDSQFHDAEEVCVNRIPSVDPERPEVGVTIFPSPDIASEDGVYEDCAQYLDFHTETGTCNIDGRMHADLFETDGGYKSGCGIKDDSSLTFTTTAEVISHTSDACSGNPEHSMSDQDCEDSDTTSKLINCPDVIQHFADQNSRTTPDYQSSDDSSNSKPQRICDEEFGRRQSTHFASSVSDSGSNIIHQHLPTGSTKDLKDSNSCEIIEEFVYSVGDDEEYYSPSCNFDITESHIELNKVPAMILDDTVHNGSGIIQRFSPVNRSNHSEDNYESPSSVWHQSIYKNLQPDLSSQHSVTSESTNHCEIGQIPGSCAPDAGSTSLDSSTDITDTVSGELSYSTKETPVAASCCYNQNAPHKSYTQSVTEEDEHNQSVTGHKQSVTEEESYKQSVMEDSEYKQSAGNICVQNLVSDSSCEQVTESANTTLNREQITNNEVSSYRQHISNDAEEMDTETTDEDVTITHVSVNSSIYQSYEDITADCSTTAVLIETSEMAQCPTNDVQTSEINPTDTTNSSATISSTEIPACQTSEGSSTPTQNTVSETATSSTEISIISTTSAPCSSPPVSPPLLLMSNSGDHERLFSPGDQTFMSTSSRQQGSVPFMPAGCSLPYVSGMNPSMYAGAAMVQGMARPTVMTSSSVHFAQHPSGATIMQHQSMRTGMNGGMTQATVMQQQAMHNGVQATSVLQRTLTNGGQTMMVQQRTMTTGLDGMTQQTVVQQQVAAPGMAQAAMYHANAMRQRSMASQQAASMMQQRSIRLVQTGVMGSPVLHAQSLGGAALIPGGALIGHGLLRGVGQGTMMQQIVRQRYLGGPVMPGRGVQLMAGRPIRVKMTYSRESMPMDT